MHKIIAELKSGTYTEISNSDISAETSETAEAAETPEQDTNTSDNSQKAVPIPPASLESIKTAPMQLNNIKSQAISSASPKNYSSKKHKK